MFKGRRSSRFISKCLGGSLQLPCFKVPQREPFIFKSKVTQFKTFINNVKGCVTHRSQEKIWGKSEEALLYRQAAKIKVGLNWRREGSPCMEGAPPVSHQNMGSYRALGPRLTNAFLGILAGCCGRQPMTQP